MSLAHPLAELDEQDVAEFLRIHPDFFDRFPNLMIELSLPHESGKAVSLVERQVAILRERNIDMRKRLNQLVHSANVNDQLFEKIRSLTLALMDAASLEDVDNILHEKLAAQFSADRLVCYIARPAMRLSCQHLISTEQLPLPHLTLREEPTCGVLREEEFSELFPGSEGKRGSAAIVRLGPTQEHAGFTGLLAIGSFDLERFTPEMGTLFVCYIGDVVSRTLGKFL